MDATANAVICPYQIAASFCVQKGCDFMTMAFDSEIAKNYGIQSAVILGYIECSGNVPTTMQELQNIFPFIGANEISKSVEALCKAGFIETKPESYKATSV